MILTRAKAWNKARGQRPNRTLLCGPKSQIRVAFTFLAPVITENFLLSFSFPLSSLFFLFFLREFPLSSLGLGTCQEEKFWDGRKGPCFLKESRMGSGKAAEWAGQLNGLVCVLPWTRAYSLEKEKKKAGSVRIAGESNGPTLAGPVLA